ncbi:phosphatase domain-containing protein [Ponticoccus sp. (in: a-proteobacteria)]|uniref:phosphatase domain-containing protein n=1 Tax=Ponticoccus sp. (in: a-proteobacteria) TaxID=1925025 RepID=UPI003AB33966
MALTRAARGVEGLIERAFRREGRPMLKAYRGYAEPGGLVLQGRVVSAVRRAAPEADQTRWTNFRQMLSLFLTSEVRDVRVRAEGVEALSDAEGYVRLHVPRAPDHAGWVHVAAELAEGGDDPVPMPVLVPQAEARFGVISDIDDTVLRTGAHSLLRNLWTTFTGNALTREVFDDAIALMRRLHEGGRNPVYYVSSSPWNLFAFLEKIFDRAGLVPGPMFLRDLGVSDRGLIGAGHGDHKGASIDAILCATPGLRFWLIGDTGQKDVLVYRDAVARHPGRIGGVILRQASGRVSARTRAAMDEIGAGGVPVAVVASFDDLGAAVLPGDQEGKAI